MPNIADGISRERKRPSRGKYVKSRRRLGGPVVADIRPGVEEQLFIGIVEQAVLEIGGAEILRDFVPQIEGLLVTRPLFPGQFVEFRLENIKPVPFLLVDSDFHELGDALDALPQIFGLGEFAALGQVLDAQRVNCFARTSMLFACVPASTNLAIGAWSELTASSKRYSFPNSAMRCSHLADTSPERAFP